MFLWLLRGRLIVPRNHGKPQSVTANTWSQRMHLCTACRWPLDRVAFQRNFYVCAHLLAVSADAVGDVAHISFNVFWISSKTEESTSSLKIFWSVCVITGGWPALSFVFARVAVRVLLPRRASNACFIISLFYTITFYLRLFIYIIFCNQTDQHKCCKKLFDKAI